MSSFEFLPLGCTVAALFLNNTRSRSLIRQRVQPEAAGGSAQTRVALSVFVVHWSDERSTTNVYSSKSESEIGFLSSTNARSLFSPCSGIELSKLMRPKPILLS